MSSTLNEKIKMSFLDPFDKHSVYSWDDKADWANKIEALILQEKMKMLEQLVPEITMLGYTNPFLHRDVIGLHKQLTQQLNQLNK